MIIMIATATASATSIATATATAAVLSFRLAYTIMSVTTAFIETHGEAE